MEPRSNSSRPQPRPARKPMVIKQRRELRRQGQFACKQCKMVLLLSKGCKPCGTCPKCCTCKTGTAPALPPNG